MRQRLCANVLFDRCNPRTGSMRGKENEETDEKECKVTCYSAGHHFILSCVTGTVTCDGHHMTL